MAGTLVLAGDLRVGRLLRDVLEAEGHQVLVVDAGESALLQLRATLHPIVALLLDLPLTMALPALLTAAHAERQLLAPHAYIVATANLDRLRTTIPQELADLDVAILSAPLDLEKLLAEVRRLAERFPERWR